MTTDYSRDNNECCVACFVSFILLQMGLAILTFLPMLGDHCGTHEIPTTIDTPTKTTVSSEHVLCVGRMLLLMLALLD